VSKWSENLDEKPHRSRVGHSQKSPFSGGGQGPRLIHGSLSPPESTSQTIDEKTFLRFFILVTHFFRFLTFFLFSKSFYLFKKRWQTSERQED